MPGGEVLAAKSRLLLIKEDAGRARPLLEESLVLLRQAGETAGS